MPTVAGIVQSAPEGVKGFDANTRISAAAAQQFLERGYRFCLRYVGRLGQNAHDLTRAEAQDIVNAGLALMVVQHVKSEDGWTPDGALGDTYGVNAATFAGQAGIPPGVNVWLDLEAVARGTPAANVAAYCENWYRRVKKAGYVPGLYVGWHAGLTGRQLYSLPFRHYWGAYNVNDDMKPACDWCLKQKEPLGGTIAGIRPDTYDDNVTRTDKAGRNVQWLVSVAHGRQTA
ncbi:MAG TPA: DUF1906 domain-containing protein [Longimicrobium sp.]|nr:DUF1906 domain-containing protein [Longimicrobium sp.]